MAKPSFAQVEEFFRQVDAGKINDSSFQLFLEGLRKVRPFTFEEFEDMIRHLRCSCGVTLGLERYRHQGGWMVEGLDSRQWLFTTCWGCKKETSLKDWGIPQNIVKS